MGVDFASADGRSSGFGRRTCGDRVTTVTSAGRAARPSIPARWVAIRGRGLRRSYRESMRGAVIAISCKARAPLTPRRSKAPLPPAGEVAAPDAAGEGTLDGAPPSQPSPASGGRSKTKTSNAKHLSRLRERSPRLTRRVRARRTAPPSQPSPASGGRRKTKTSNAKHLSLLRERSPRLTRRVRARRPAGAPPPPTPPTRGGGRKRSAPPRPRPPPPPPPPPPLSTYSYGSVTG
jgi:hypothetical protein